MEEEVTNEGLEQLVNKDGKEHCELTRHQTRTKDNKQRQLSFLRIDVAQGADAMSIPKHLLLKKRETVKFPSRRHVPQLQFTETNQLESLRKWRGKAEEETQKEETEGQRGAPENAAEKRRCARNVPSKDVLKVAFQMLSSLFCWNWHHQP